MQLSVAQRMEGIDVIKVDTGHMIHFGYDDLKAQSGMTPHEAIWGTSKMRHADRVRFASEAWQRAIDFSRRHRLIRP